MKILHVNTEKGWRGGEQQLFYLAKGLKERGIESVVACRKGEELERRCRKADIETIPLSGRQVEDFFRVGVIGKRFDLIHAHTAKAHTIAALSKKFHKKPVVYTRRVDYQPKKNRITALKYGLTDRVVAISHCVKDVLQSCLPIPNGKLKVIYSTVDSELEKNVNLEKVKEIKETLNGKPLIGTVAALTSQKNIPNFIKAAKLLIEKYPNAKFVVLGEGKLRKELQSLITQLNLEKTFKLLGFKEDVQNYIKAFDIFVLPSDFEGLGSSILIAMSLNIPVVSTDAGGARDVVFDGKTGILVPKRNPKALADGISKLLADKTLKEQLVSNAYNLVRNKFTVDKMVDAYIALYGEVSRSGKNLG